MAFGITQKLEQQLLGELWVGQTKDLMADEIGMEGEWYRAYRDGDGSFVIENKDDTDKWYVPTLEMIPYVDRLAINAKVSHMGKNVDLAFRGSGSDDWATMLRVDFSFEHNGELHIVGLDGQEYLAEPWRAFVDDLLLSNLPQDSELQIQIRVVEGITEFIILSMDGNELGRYTINKNMFPFGFVEVQANIGPKSTIELEKLERVNPNCIER